MRNKIRKKTKAKKRYLLIGTLFSFSLLISSFFGKKENKIVVEELKISQEQTQVETTEEVKPIEQAKPKNLPEEEKVVEKVEMSKYEQIMIQYLEDRKSGKYSQYPNGVNPRIACAFRVRQILELIDPKYTIFQSNSANGFVIEVEKFVGSNGIQDKTSDKIKNLGIITYGYWKGGRIDSGHVGIVYRLKNGELNVINNSSNQGTPVLRKIDKHVSYPDFAYIPLD